MVLARGRHLDASDPIDFDAFAATLSGRLLRPGDPEYDSARLTQNRAYNRYPAAIVKAADASDVARAVSLARDAGLDLAVRSGGHSVAGHSTADDALMLDLSGMKGLHIDPVRRLVWAQPGLTAGEVTNALAEHGLAVPFGDTSSVGIAGLTLGGGIGYLVRKHGLAIDNLVSVELVTAHGRLLIASERQNPELFWALRGGGGNFGVATRFVYRAQPVSTVFGGAIFLPGTRAVIESIMPLAEAAPEDLSVIAFVMHAPPAPFIPADRVGELSVMLTFVYAGDPAGGEAAIAPFRALAEPIADLAGPMPYPGIYAFTEEGAKAEPFVVRSAFLDGLDERVVDTIIEYMSRATTPGAMVQLRGLGGAMARVPAGATAFGHRSARVLFAVITVFEGPAEPHVAWTEALFDAVRPLARGVYSNFLDDEGEGRIREAYPAETFVRLAEVKRRYDPSNLFRLNQNIAPAR
jgi:FAD/FMN-containing dehydrogenase